MRSTDDQQVGRYGSRLPPDLGLGLPARAAPAVQPPIRGRGQTHPGPKGLGRMKPVREARPRRHLVHRLLPPRVKASAANARRRSHPYRAGLSPTTAAKRCGNCRVPSPQAAANRALSGGAFRFSPISRSAGATTAAAPATPPRPPDLLPPPANHPPRARAATASMAPPHPPPEAAPPARPRERDHRITWLRRSSSTSPSKFPIVSVQALVRR